MLGLKRILIDARPAALNHAPRATGGVAHGARFTIAARTIQTLI